MAIFKNKKVKAEPQVSQAESPVSIYPANLEGLLQDGWQKTHQAANGNFIYTRHLAIGFRYAEVDDKGKVVEVRSV